MTCTLIRVDNGLPFVASATLVSNSDGSVSFLLPNGQYAGQEPNSYGTRNDSATAQQYQRATLVGSTVTFLPLAQYPPCVYLYGASQVYPA